MEDIFLLVEHSRDLGEVHVLGWFATEVQAREAAEALEWQARRDAEQLRATAQPVDSARSRRYWVKGISRFKSGALASSTTLH